MGHEVTALKVNIKLTRIEGLDNMQEINTVFVGKLKAGQADIEGWKLNETLSEVHKDDSTYFYNFTDWNADDIIPSIECAFFKDPSCSMDTKVESWTITYTNNGPVVRIDF